MEKKYNVPFEEKFEEVGAMWSKEGNFSIKINSDITADTRLMVLKNRFADEGENRPAYRLWREKVIE